LGSISKTYLPSVTLSRTFFKVLSFFAGTRNYHPARERGCKKANAMAGHGTGHLLPRTGMTLLRIRGSYKIQKPGEGPVRLQSLFFSSHPPWEAYPKHCQGLFQCPVTFCRWPDSHPDADRQCPGETSKKKSSALSRAFLHCVHSSVGRELQFSMMLALQADG
jgi:hypothetical protein